MFISIIVPLYNSKEFLVRCLESIHRQTFTDYEVIVVDDGSTDGSGELAESYCADKENFHVFHKENGGVITAWKYGFEQAKGEYIGAVDSDDFIDSDMYAVLVEKAKQHDADIVMCNHRYVSEDLGQETPNRNPISGGFYEGETLEAIKAKALPACGKDYISPSRCTKIIRKELLGDCFSKYADERVSSGDDVMIIVPCTLACKSLYYVDQAFYSYVYRPVSISHTFKDGLFSSYSVLIDHLSKCLSDLGLDQKLQKEREDLYNFYGVLWSVYVFNSTLPTAQKKVKLKEAVEASAFQVPAACLTRASGMTAWLYKQMMKLHSPSVFLTGKKLLKILKK